MKTNVLGLIALILWSHGNFAWTADGKANSSVLAFVQKYKGLYASEVKDTGAFSRPLTARKTIAPYDVALEYNDSAKEIRIGTYDRLQRTYENQLEVMESCFKTGEATGTTGMGVKVSFIKRNCHRLFLTAVDKKWLGQTQPISLHPL